MVYLLIIALVLLVAFAGVLVRGAPYLPTMERQATAALDMLALKPGQTLLELGSGDGKVLLLAARQGLQVVGIELNPFLVAVSWLRTRRYRRQVRIIWGDFWRVEWPPYDGAFTFLLDRFMRRLDKRMQGSGKPLVSFAFQIPGRKASKVRDGIYLYKY